MENLTMGKRIMTLRKEQGLTQEQLAEKLGVSAQAVSKWENDVSCPDISIIPQLADVLRVSTDELLGAKPIEPRVVVVDSGAQEKKKRRHGSYNFVFSAGGGIMFAVALVVVGLSFLLQRLGVISFNVWSIIWPAVILGLGVAWAVEDFSVFGVGVGLLGLYFLLFNLGAIEFALTWGIIWPILLVLLGVSILVEKLVKKRFKKRNHSWHWDAKNDPVTEYSENDGYIRLDCAFAEDNHKVTTESFAGGHIDISFGKSVLDITSCKTVLPDALLDVDVSFGSFELLVPRCIKVGLSEEKAFGSITIKGSPNEGATEKLYLKGDVSFGNLTIRYI